MIVLNCMYLCHDFLSSVMTICHDFFNCVMTICHDVLNKTVSDYVCIMSCQVRSFHVTLSSLQYFIVAFCL
jgi:hypothetical protein